MQQLDVLISVKPKPRQLIQSVIIKSIEQNMQCMYQTRLMLLECTCTEHFAGHVSLAGREGRIPWHYIITVIPEHPEEEAHPGQPL